MSFKILSLLVLSIIYGTEPIREIKLESHQKALGTFSGTLADGYSTFHLIMTKNKETKQYEILPFTKIKGKTTALTPVSLDKEMGVLSFHNSGGRLQVITQSGKRDSKVFNIVDLNLESGNSRISADIPEANFKTHFRADDKTFLIFVNDNSLRVLDVTTSNQIKTVEIPAEGDFKEFITELKDGNIESVRTDEYVKNGSTAKFQLYYQNDKLSITRNDDSDNSVDLLEIGETADSSKINSFKGTELEDQKRSASYLKNGKIYHTKVAKKSSFLDIHDTQTGESKTIDFWGVEVKNAVNNTESIERFQKKSRRGSNTPTTTVNKTRDGLSKVRIDYVDTKTYSYSHDWWWFHNWMWQNQLWQMQMNQMNFQPPAINGFGPSPYFRETTTLTIAVPGHFEFALDEQGNVLSADGLETEVDFIDTKEYITKLNEDKVIKHHSSVFHKGLMTYFAYDKRSKSFIIRTKAL
jgi:hypothetical protein